jgi:hypothetical protein
MPKQIAFKTVYTVTKDHKARVALGGKCDAWEDFAEHTLKRLGKSPWNLPGSLSVSRQFVDYWLAQTGGACADNEASTGACIDYGRSG